LQLDNFCLFFCQQTATTFRLHNKETADGLWKIAWASVFRLTPPTPCLNVSMSPCFRNSAKGKWQLPFVFCKREAETANFCLFAANGKRLFVFICAHTTNGNRQLLYKKTFPSMLMIPRLFGFKPNPSSAWSPKHKHTVSIYFSQC
jgi:hypothetical protein